MIRKKTKEFQGVVAKSALRALQNKAKKSNEWSDVQTAITQLGQNPTVQQRAEAQRRVFGFENNIESYKTLAGRLRRGEVNGEEYRGYFFDEPLENENDFHRTNIYCPTLSLQLLKKGTAHFDVFKTKRRFIACLEHLIFFDDVDQYREKQRKHVSTTKQCEAHQKLILQKHGIEDTNLLDRLKKIEDKISNDPTGQVAADLYLIDLENNNVDPE